MHDWLAAVAVPRLTRIYGMTGAAWAYALMMVLLSAIYLMMAGYYLKKWESGCHI